MTIETSTYISELNTAYPEAGSSFSEGDDHLRKLKANIKATFPNFTAIACTPSSVEFNYLTGVTSAIQAQFAAKAPLASPTLTGTVVLPSTTSIGTVSATEIGYLDNVTSAIQTQIDAKAPTASPTLTGTPAAPTATPGTNTTQLATTAFVIAQGLSSALPGQAGNAGKYVSTDGATATWQDPFASAPLTGTPTAPTAAGGTNTTQIATTAFVAASFAPLASPTLTGTPASTTAAAGTNTTQIATTAFVTGAVGAYAANAIGTYIFARASSPLTGPGNTIAGSSLQVASISSVPALQTDSGAYSLSGTWRCMGHGNTSNTLATLWLRIS